mgnify:FL=1
MPGEDKGNRGYQLLYRVAKTEAKDYIRNYCDAERFIGYCRQCPRYNTYWSCPPYGFDVKEYLTRYTDVILVGTQLFPDAALRSECTDAKQSTWITYRLIGEVRRTLDKGLLEWESEYAPARAFFAGGMCYLCPMEGCARARGLPCRHPDKVRPPLEAFGFDIGKTTSQLLGVELQWGRKGSLPEYFTLVSALFTNSKESDIIPETLY